MIIKACSLLFDRFRIIRGMCMLLLALSVVSLTGCGKDTTPEGGNVEGYHSSTSGCWVCPIIEKATTAINSASGHVISSVSNSAKGLVAVGYALWLAIFILKNVSSLHEPDAAAFWKGLAVQTFWAVMGIALLRDLASGGTGSALKSFAEPVFNAFIGAGMEALNGMGAGISCGGGGMTCLVQALHEKLNGGVLMGISAIFIGGNIFIVTTGVIVLITSAILMVYLPLMLVDCVLRYGIALCMLPLAVAAYSFKITRGFTGTVVKMIIQVGLATLGMAVYAGFCANVLKDYIDQYAPFTRTVASAAMDDPAQFEKDLSSPGMFGLMFISFFLVLFSEVVFDFMNALVGGAGGMGKVGQQVAAAAGKSVKAAKKIGNFAANRIGRRRDLRAYNKLQNGTEKEKERAAFRLQARGYFAQGHDGKMHATKALDDLTKNQHMKGPFKGVRRAFNNVSNLSKDWNESALQRGQNRHNHSQNGYSAYDDTYGSMGKRTEAEHKAVRENRAALRKEGGLSGAGIGKVEDLQMPDYTKR